MRIIPVLDVRRGQSVRAVAGDRAHYGPLRSILHDGTDPILLAKAGPEVWGLPDLYLADLDAILGEAPPNFVLYRLLREIGLTLWIDAGLRDARLLPRLIDSGVDLVIVGLETIGGPEALAEIVALAGVERVVFSLDLRDSKPLVETSSLWGTDDYREIARKVLDLGIQRLIHLDLATVGTRRNDHIWEGSERLRWLADHAKSHPGFEWLIGGGINSREELTLLESLGASGVLIGSALHEGRLVVPDLNQ